MFCFYQEGYSWINIGSMYRLWIVQCNACMNWILNSIVPVNKMSVFARPSAHKMPAALAPDCVCVSLWQTFQHSAPASAVYIHDKTLQSQVSAKDQTLRDRGHIKGVNKEPDTQEIHLHWVENVKQQQGKKKRRGKKAVSLGAANT